MNRFSKLLSVLLFLTVVSLPSFCLANNNGDDGDNFFFEPVTVVQHGDPNTPNVFTLYVDVSDELHMYAYILQFIEYKKEYFDQTDYKIQIVGVLARTPQQIDFYLSHRNAQNFFGMICLAEQSPAFSELYISEFDLTQSILDWLDTKTIPLDEERFYSFFYKDDDEGNLIEDYFKNASLLAENHKDASQYLPALIFNGKWAVISEIEDLITEMGYSYEDIHMKAKAIKEMDN